MTEKLGSDVFAGERVAPIDCGPPGPHAELQIILSPYRGPLDRVPRKSFLKRIFLFFKGIFQR